MTKRVDKVNELIHRELGKIMAREVELPEGVLATISRVETSPDLELSKIFLTIYPTSDQKNILKKIIKQRQQLQYLLHQRLILKPMPKIKFLIVGEDPVEKVEKLLDEVIHNSNVDK